MRCLNLSLCCPRTHRFLEGCATTIGYSGAEGWWGQTRGQTVQEFILFGAALQILSCSIWTHAVYGCKSTSTDVRNVKRRLDVTYRRPRSITEHSLRNTGINVLVTSSLQLPRPCRGKVQCVWRVHVGARVRHSYLTRRVHAGPQLASPLEPDSINYAGWQRDWNYSQSWPLSAVTQLFYGFVDFWPAGDQAGIIFY
jgi:hypothetical protein